jgi:hypothetical protein
MDYDVDPAVLAALIAAGVAVVAALISTYLTIWGTLRQHAVDLVVAALSHMGGGTQERSEGIAALMALRGPIDHQPRRVDRGGWASNCTGSLYMFSTTARITRLLMKLRI